MSEVTSIAPADVMDKVSQGAYLVDIRDVNSYQNSHIKNSERIDNESLPTFYAKQTWTNLSLFVVIMGLALYKPQAF